ncbi:MAG: HD domain-containing protein [Defluviitaleaceae bacterium]|nr:HD domain-containing protein [Defluviitaleaceae bacterium]
MHTPIKTINTRRCDKLIRFFLKRAEAWRKEGRDFSIYWSISHMITAAQTARLLAVSRKLDIEILSIAGALHDVATMETGISENHAQRSLDFIKPLLREFNEANGDSSITEDEIALLEEIIPQHSDKDIISGNPYAEALKDADALDRYLHGIEVRESEMPRLVKVLSEVNIESGV